MGPRKAIQRQACEGKIRFRTAASHKRTREQEGTGPKGKSQRDSVLSSKKTGKKKKGRGKGKGSSRSATFPVGEKRRAHENKKQEKRAGRSHDVPSRRGRRKGDRQTEAEG